jgi:hypothetical protein
MKSFVTCIFIFCSLGLVSAFISGKSTGGHTTSAAEYSDTIPQRNPRGNGRRINPYPILLQKFFTRTWNGFTVCKGDTSKVPSVLTITSKDPVDVYVSGLIHQNSKVVAAIRGYMVIIRPQKIHSPKGEHLVEGDFILSNDFNSLTGKYTSKLKGKTDTCIAVYRAQQ